MTSWAQVLSLWKKKDSYVSDGILNAEALEQTFPSQAAGDSAVLNSIWDALDANRSGYVSLAEYDSWCNDVILKHERATLRKKNATLSPLHGENKGTLWVYARPSFIRAFTLANSRTLTKPNADVKDDDFITRRELHLLLAATQCCLRIYRLFDVADIDDDRRISKCETSVWRRRGGGSARPAAEMTLILGTR